MSHPQSEHSPQHQELVERIRACPNLPSLPTIAVQILDLAARPEVDIAEIARIISKDPALAGKILRTVNSSFYGRSQHVSTISHALVILGLQSVKTLVLGFSLVSNLTKQKAKGFKHLSYWRHSIYSATAARSIAAKVGVVQQEEAFLSGLLMDIGMLVLDQVVPDGAYGEVFASVDTHAKLAAAEQAALGMNHAQVGGMLAEQWKLPPVLTMPIRYHHDPALVDDAALRKVVDIVHVSSRCADVFVDEQAAAAIADVRALLQDRQGLAADDCDALMAEIGKKTKEVASLFEINIGPSADFDAVLRKANETLVELTLRTQQQATQFQQQASTLAHQNQQLQRQASVDALTGLANRARFDEVLAERFAACLANGQPLALLMLDVDRFKTINDRFGHPTGDRVLKAMGALFSQAAREQDLAARYGGEELCLLLPGTTRPMATMVAETIRRAIAARPVSAGTSAPLPVTASIGVAVFEPANTPFRAPAHLLKAADLALYAAKHGGRNCVKVFALPAAKPKPAAA